MVEASRFIPPPRSAVTYFIDVKKMKGGLQVPLGLALPFTVSWSLNKMSSTEFNDLEKSLHIITGFGPKLETTSPADIRQNQIIFPASFYKRRDIARELIYAGWDIFEMLLS